MLAPRKIIHIDMDAFYASVEEKDDPSLKGKPLVVGGDPKSRGVAATCNYEARKYGIHSAMSCAEAYRRCPKAIFVKPRMERYRDISQQIRNVFYEMTEQVELLSLDEAYLDVTQNRINEPMAHKLAKHIKLRILQDTALVASAGVGPNKLIAKIASDIKKPDGLSIVTQSQAYSFLSPLPVSKIWGVGRARRKQLERLGYYRIKDLQHAKLTTLMAQQGNFGSYLFYAAQGIDDRPVKNKRERKSYSTERTFEEDIRDPKMLKHYLGLFSKELGEASKKYKPKTLTLKLKFDNFESLTRSKTFAEVFAGDSSLYDAAVDLLNQVPIKRGVRLLGLGISSFEKEKPLNPQMSLL